MSETNNSKDPVLSEQKQKIAPEVLQNLQNSVVSEVTTLEPEQNKTKIPVQDWLFDRFGVVTDEYDGDICEVDQSDLDSISHDRSRKMLDSREVLNLMNWIDTGSDYLSKIQLFDVQTRQRMREYKEETSSKNVIIRELCLGILTENNEKLVSDDDLERWANCYGFKEIMLQVMKCNQLGWLPVADSLDRDIMVRLIRLKPTDTFRSVLVYFICSKQQKLFQKYQDKGWSNVLRLFKLDQYL